MNNWIVVVLVSLMSSVAFAEEAAPPAPAPVPVPVEPTNREQALSYQCHFDCSQGQAAKKSGVECWVEGTLCREFDQVNSESRRCKGGEDPIEIKCSNGFRLFARDSAVELDRKTLWINADQYNDVATLRVDKFFKDDITVSNDRDDFRRRADLLVSSDGKGGTNAFRLEGSCKFESSHR